MPVKFGFSEPDVLAVDWYRAALSVRGHQNRLEALKGLHEKMSLIELDAAFNKSVFGQSRFVVPSNELANDQTYSMASRNGQIAVFEEALREYEKQAKIALLGAELIAQAIWLTINEGRNRGVYSARGILERVSHEAREQSIYGLRDIDTLRKNWKEYKGVAHLGAGVLMARMVDYDDETGVLLGEKIRHCLSHECPVGQRSPYVDEEDQLFFLYKSVT